MKDGMIEDWDVFEKVLDYTYDQCMKTKSQYHPVVFSEASVSIVFVFSLSFKLDVRFLLSISKNILKQ